MKEVMDNTVTVIKNALSATPIDRDRLVVGTDDGLFCVDLERDGQYCVIVRNICTRDGFIFQKSVELVTARKSIK